jgi:probable HAF family extracellular repeat protein
MRHSLRLSLILSTILCAHVALPQTDAFLWTTTGGMQDLGVLPGWQDSNGSGINDSGVIVGGLFKTNENRTCFGWKDGLGIYYLKGLSPTNSSAVAVNNQGQAVGYSLVGDGQTHAFLWTRESGAQDLGTLGGPSGVALAINNSGQVVGWSQTATGIVHAFLWTQETGMQDLMTLTHGTCTGCESFAEAINDSGVIVGKLGHHEGARDYAFVWENGYVKVLGDLGGVGINGGSEAAGINKSGQVVGTAAVPDGSGHAFLWTEAGGMQDLGTLPGGSGSSAAAINSSGQVVGSAYVPSGQLHAFIWDSVGGMQDLGTLGGPGSQAAAINDSGEVTGMADLP